MTEEAIKELFYKASDNAINYHYSTEVISIDSAMIIIDEVFESLQNKTCEYKIESDWNQDNIYHFECGYSYVTIEGDLHDNGINFCPYCGGKAKQKDTK